jgi:suppressor of G2 allele of SKP1
MATQALEAFNAGNYALAVTLYTTLLSQYPGTLDYYIKRSTANQRTADYTSALSDAEVAIVLAHRRSRKDVLATAQLRRGIALYMLERYGDAAICFKAVKRLNEKERGLDIWMGKCEKGLNELPEDDKRRLGNVKEIPDVDVPKLGGSAASGGGKEKMKPHDDRKKEQSDVPAKNPVVTAVQTPADKIRHEWYQTGQSVVFTLLAKGVPKDKATIDIQEDSVSHRLTYKQTFTDH